MVKQTNTRTRILDIAESAILSKGFDATSIEEIVAAAEITKGGFFYHFPDKSALARALIERYIEAEDQLFDDLFARARDLNDDPLHMVMIALKLMAEMLEDMPNGHPGCLIATSAYQDRLFDPIVRDLNRNALLSWRKRFRTALNAIVEEYPPRDKVDLDDLADMFTAIMEGGIILQKALNDPTAMARQIMLLRSYLKLMFSPSVH